VIQVGGAPITNRVGYTRFLTRSYVVVVVAKDVGKATLFELMTKEANGGRIITVEPATHPLRVLKRNIAGEEVRLDVKNAAGRLRADTQELLKSAEVLAILYDITCGDSLAHVRKWVKDIDAASRVSPARLILGKQEALLFRFPILPL
jgi:hypothetical protein